MIGLAVPRGKRPGTLGEEVVRSAQKRRGRPLPGRSGHRKAGRPSRGGILEPYWPSLGHSRGRHHAVRRRPPNGVDQSGGTREPASRVRVGVPGRVKPHLSLLPPRPPGRGPSSLWKAQRWGHRPGKGRGGEGGASTPAGQTGACRCCLGAAWPYLDTTGALTVPIRSDRLLACSSISSRHAGPSFTPRARRRG
jgi:hypothetical protein